MNLKAFFYPPINQKRKAAIWILKEVTKDLKHKYPVSGIYDANGNKKDVDPTPSFKTYKFKDLQPKSGFSKETFYYALCMLDERKHITPYFGSKFDYNVIEFEGNPEGHTALHDRVYENEITAYNNDRLYSSGRWALPMAAILISLLSLYFSTCKKQPPTILPLLRIDTIKSAPILPLYPTPQAPAGSQSKKEKDKTDTVKKDASKTNPK